MKTKNEAAKEFVQSRNYSTLNTPKLKEEAYDGFIAGVEFAQRWIPIEEELPEEGKIVLMKTLSSVFVGVFEDSHFYLNEIVNNTQLIFVGVIEWRPIENN